MRSNSRMLSALKGVLPPDVEAPALHPDLLHIIKEKFSYKNGCLLSKVLGSYETNAQLSSFPDKTGFECFLNSFHVDDFVEEYHLYQGFLFSVTLLENWKTDKNHPIQAILISSEYSTVVKFHVVRKDEDWLGGNLESDTEGILAATKLDLPELRKLVTVFTG